MCPTKKGIKTEWLFLAAILAGVLAARLPFLLGGVLGGDAAYHARAAVTVLNGGLLYRDVPFTYPPLYAYTEAAAIAVLGNVDIGWKAVAQIYDIGSIILVYLIASRSLGRNKGLAAAALYGFSPLPFFATSSFASFDSTAVFWMLASLLLPLMRKTVPSAVALGIGTAYKYFPLILLPAALVYLQTKRQRILYAVASVGTVALTQLPFLLTEFKPWLDNVILYHINRPASGATIYNLLTLHPQFFDVQTPLTLLSPITLLLAFLLVALSRDQSDAGLLKNSAFIMLVAVFFSKVVLFYALWFIPLLCTFLLTLKKRSLTSVIVPFFVLQVALLLGWYASDVWGNPQIAFFFGYVYLSMSGVLTAWLLGDRLRFFLKRRTFGKE